MNKKQLKKLKKQQLESITEKIDKLFDSIRFGNTIKAVYEIHKGGETLNAILLAFENEDAQPELTPEDNARVFNQVSVTCEALKKNPDISCDDLVNLLIK